MNRHDRRQRAAAAKGYEEFADNAQGAVEVYFVHERQIPDLILQGFNDDPRAVAFVHAIAGWLSRRAENRPLCMNPNCSAEFSADTAPPPLLVVAAPFATVKGSALIMGVCEKCCTLGQEKLQEIAMANLKKLWPSIGVMPDGRTQ